MKKEASSKEAKKKVSLHIKPLESKITPSCDDVAHAWMCQSAGGTVVDLGGYYQCAFGNLAAVADY